MRSLAGETSTQRSTQQVYEPRDTQASLRSVLYRPTVAANILICDDEKNIRRTLAMVLEGLGHRILEAMSGEEALGMIENEELDLVILDVRLPRMNGIEALQAIRAKPQFAELPVIMISGHASLAEAVHS